MKVRKRLTIVQNDGSDLKINLYFLAAKMNLSGWVIHVDRKTVQMEIQGTEENMKKYIGQILALFDLNKSDIHCQSVKLLETEEGSLKIG